MPILLVNEPTIGLTNAKDKMAIISVILGPKISLMAIFRLFRTRNIGLTSMHVHVLSGAPWGFHMLSSHTYVEVVIFYFKVHLCDLRGDSIS